MIKNYNNVSLTAGLITGSVVTLIIVAFFIEVDLKSAEHVVKIISYPFIAGSAIIALLKYKQDNAWNKKHLAYEKISSYVKELEDFRLDIDKAVIEMKAIENESKEIISFTDRRRINSPLTHEEVHKWVCKDTKVSKTSDMCSMSENGVIVIRNLLSIINTYEIIAIGIKSEMLDEDLVRESLEHVIIKNFEFFKPYIEHRRDKHEDKTLAEEWEILYSEWC